MIDWKQPSAEVFLELIKLLFSIMLRRFEPSGMELPASGLRLIFTSERAWRALCADGLS
jgi:hypothetical protein